MGRGNKEDGPKQIDCNGERNGSKRQIGAVRGTGELAGRAALDANETCLITGAIARSDFLFSLLVGHALIDAVKNLAFGEAGVFQAGDLAAREDPSIVN